MRPGNETVNFHVGVFSAYVSELLSVRHLLAY